MILNPYRFSTTAPATPFDGFGNASRNFVLTSLQYVSINGAEPTGYPFTLATWIKTDNLTRTAQAIICAGNSGGAEKFSLEVNNATIRLRAQGSTNDIFTGGTITTGWHHVVGVFTSATSRELYVDGTSVGTGTATSVTYPAGIDGCDIGRQLDSSPSNFFSGNLADCRIYDAALTSTNVTDLYAGTDIQTNLVGHWLKDTDDVLDHAGVNDGTNNGSTYSYKNPSPSVEFGNASRYFDGTDDVFIPDNADIPTGAQTICTWVKLDTLTSTSGQDLITHWTTAGGVNQAGFAVYLPASGGKVRFYITSDGSGGTLESAEATDVISALTWAHVACVLSPSNHLKIYINGSLSVTLSTSITAIHDSTVDLVFGGRDQTTVTTPLQGNLADVRIYDTDLSASDIADIYSGTNITTNLIGHWLTNSDDVEDKAGLNDGANNGSTYSTDSPF